MWQDTPKHHQQACFTARNNFTELYVLVFVRINFISSTSIWTPPEMISVGLDFNGNALMKQLETLKQLLVRFCFDRWKNYIISGLNYPDQLVHVHFKVIFFYT